MTHTHTPETSQAIVITFTLDSCSAHLSSSSSTMSGWSIPNAIPSFSLGTHLPIREVQQYDLHPGFFNVAVSYIIVHLCMGGLSLFFLGGGDHKDEIQRLTRSDCENPTTASTRHMEQYERRQKKHDKNKHPPPHIQDPAGSCHMHLELRPTPTRVDMLILREGLGRRSASLTSQSNCFYSRNNRSPLLSWV